MAEAPQRKPTQGKRAWKGLVRKLFRLIKENSLDGIKQIFDQLQPAQRITILNSTLYDCLPLYLAVKLNYVEVSRFLIEMSLLQGPHEMTKHWKQRGHPLVIAIKNCHLELIQLILQHLPDINETISGPMTPLMFAISTRNLISVQLIVPMGADVNRLCQKGRTPLMYSTSNSKICSFLLSRGANVNHQDDYGFTALHFAVLWNYPEGVRLLANAGADVSIRNRDGINPLILAIIHQNMPMMTCLDNHPSFSKLDRIEAIEMLNASCVCAQEPHIGQWMQSLLLRRSNNLPKNNKIPARAVLDYSREFTTEMELVNLQSDPLLLAFQSILVVERMLGRNNRFYVQFLVQTAVIAKRGNNGRKVRQLIDYIQEFCGESSFVTENLSCFQNLFYAIAKYNHSNSFFQEGGFAIFRLIAQTALKVWFFLKERVYTHPSNVDTNYSRIVDTFLYMTSTTNTMITSQEYLGKFREELKRVLDQDLRVMQHQTILHRAIILTQQEPWATVELIRVLLEAGADPSSKDMFGYNTVMYSYTYAPKYRPVLLKLFRKYGFNAD